MLSNSTQQTNAITSPPLPGKGALCSSGSPNYLHFRLSAPTTHSIIQLTFTLSSLIAMPTTLPPYLTSGASSRSHHALLVKLHEAKSDQEEDEILRKEITRQKDLLVVKGQSTSKVAESLIVLLHVAMLRHDTSTDLDFGLVHALHLAESGRTIQEKRIGYLFLQERLTPGHELALMLINTIRKDLSSGSPSHILLALHTIVKIPSRDLAPAVTPLLTSKMLLKHKLPAIRKRTIQAICTIYLSNGDGDFPLSMSKLVRMSTSEEDQSASSTIIGTIRLVLECGFRCIGNRDEAMFLCQHVIDIATERLGQHGQILLECLGVLRQIISSPHGQDCVPHVHDLLGLVLSSLDIDESSAGAVLLEICHIPVVHGMPSSLAPTLLAIISRGLVPSGMSSSTSQAPHIPNPNTHVLIIRCLNTLPVSIWDGQLGEAQMGTLMEGLNSPDDTIRRLTLRLLQRLSPDLPQASLVNHLQALKTSSNLSLPLHVPANLEEKTIAGRLETSGRALEVVEIMYCGSTERPQDHVENGSQCARSFVSIVAALNEGVINSDVTESRSGLGSKGQVWDAGLRRMLKILDESSGDFERGFISGIVEARIGSATLAVLRCTALSRIELSSHLAERAIHVLLEDLIDFGPSVQEIILVALSISLSQVKYDRDQVIDIIRQVQLEAGKFIKKRCGQLVDLIQQDLLRQVMQTARSRSIPDVLEAMTATHKSWCQSQSTDSKSFPNTPASPARSTSNTPSSLRYDAYEPPSSSLADLSLSRNSRPPRDGHSLTRKASKANPTPTPGDLALFDADEEDGLLDTRPVGSSKGNTRLGPISIPEATNDGLDPFKGDEARTPTMRESRHLGT